MNHLTHMTDRELALAADGGKRAALIQGLIDTAAYLAAHPSIPIPPQVTIQYTASDHGEVDRIAEAAGQEAIERGGLYDTRRYFGPVEYKAVAISGSVMAAWDDAMQVFEGAQAEGPVAA